MNVQKAIARIYGKMPVSVTAEAPADDGGITSRISAEMAGVRHYRVTFSDGSTASFTGKRKSARIILNGIRMVSGRDLRLGTMLAFRHKIFGYSGSSVREAKLYSTPGLLPAAHVPRINGSVYSRLTGGCFLAMETLPESESPLEKCLPLLDMLADFHAQFLGRADSIRSINHYTAADYRRSRRILRRIFDRLSEENAAVFSPEQIAAVHHFIARIDTEYALVSDRRTLTHNDCCDRNICVRGDRICIYDWELACCQNPEHDVVELLISFMQDMTDTEVFAALASYRKRITALTGIPLSDAEYHALLRFNTLEYCVNKLCILRLAGKHLHMEAPHQLAVQTARMMRLLQIT